MRALLVLLMFSLAACSGCSDGAGAEGGSDNEDLREQLADLSVVYAESASEDGACDSYFDFNRTWDRLENGEFSQDVPELIESGEITVRWGLVLPESTDDNYGTIVVAYAKSVPTRGGWVVFDDGTTKEWTAEDYKKNLGL